MGIEAELAKCAAEASRWPRELVAAVRAGLMSIREAKGLANLPKARQRKRIESLIRGSGHDISCRSPVDHDATDPPSSEHSSDRPDGKSPGPSPHETS